MVGHAIVQRITLCPYKLTLSTERRFLSAVNNRYSRIDLQLNSAKRLVLCALRNKRTIMREGPG